MLGLANSSQTYHSYSAAGDGYRWIHGHLYSRRIAALTGETGYNVSPLIYLGQAL